MKFYLGVLFCTLSAVAAKADSNFSFQDTIVKSFYLDANQSGADGVYLLSESTGYRLVCPVYGPVRIESVPGLNSTTNIFNVGGPKTKLATNQNISKSDCKKIKIAILDASATKTFKLTISSGDQFHITRQ